MACTRAWVSKRTKQFHSEKGIQFATPEDERSGEGSLGDEVRARLQRAWEPCYGMWVLSMALETREGFTLQGDREGLRTVEPSDGEGLHLRKV